MQSFAKLVRQIRDALAANGSNAPVESLAAEYAQLCKEANQRLESCAAMLGKGSEYQALQLAETEPVLMDLIAILSFEQVPAWEAYCLAHNLPVAPKFNPKAVQALDGLYSKGINANHPLYKDYRAAISSRDDPKALHIIRSIVRLNPSDANAKVELDRIENKLFQIKLLELRNILTQRDENGTLSALSELERLSTPAKLAELPEYARACVVRREFARREAMAVADRLCESLDEERQAGAWRMIVGILARLKTLQAEHEFNLPESGAAKCVEMQRYFDTQRAAAETKARFEQALMDLGGLAQEFDTRLLTRGSLTLAEGQNLHGKFNRKWKEIEQFQRPVPEDFVQKVRASAAALAGELDRLQRQRRHKKILLGTAVAIAMCVGAWFAIRASRVQDYATQLSALREAGQVEAAEKMIAQIRNENVSLSKSPKLTARLDEVERWTRDERAKLAGVENRLSDLEATAKTGMADSDPTVFATKLETTNQLIEALVGGLRAAPAGRILVVRNQFEAYVTTVREKLVAQADGELTSLENLVGSKLAYDQTKESIAQTLAQVDPVLKGLEARAKPSLAALELPSAQQTRLGALRERVDLFHDEVDAMGKVHEAMLQANSLEAYLHALGGYKTSKLTQTPEVSNAHKLLATAPSPDSLLAGLLLPNDATGWAAAKSDTSGEMFAPDTVLPGEITAFRALRDDRYLNDIWQLTLIDLQKRGAKRELYSRSELKKDVQVNFTTVGDEWIAWKGDVYDPSTTAEPPAFKPTNYNMRRTRSGAGSGVSGTAEVKEHRLSAVSQCIVSLELNRMTDTTETSFKKPLLAVFGGLVRDKTTGPLFKAYLMQQLASVLNVRPYAWGFEYCPSLRNDLAELGKLCGGVDLRSQDWLLERKKAQLGPKLTLFFARLQNRDYLGEARLHREILRAVVKAGLQFGGFIDSEGKANLLGEARSAKMLWSLADDGQSLVRYSLLEDVKQTAKPVTKLSPIFFVPLDREAFVSEVMRKIPKKSDVDLKLPTIPWLEKP